MDRISCKWVIFLSICLVILSCGYKGPPLPPKEESPAPKAIKG